MATYNYDATTRTLTVVFSVIEDRVVKRSAKDHGADVLKNVLETWLDRQFKSYTDRDSVSIREALQNATPQQLDAVKTALGL